MHKSVTRGEKFQAEREKNMKRFKRLAAALLVVVLLLGCTPALAADAALTRGEAAQLLLDAAGDYNPDVQLSDIMKGYPDGSTDAGGAVTRVQALVMLERAFGGLETPVGDNARMAIPSQSFTDVPAWAASELSGVLGAGIVAGTGGGRLSPDDAITRQELETLIHRVYALKGTNLKDDFYAAVNKSYLDSSDIPAGLSINGPFYGLSLTVNAQVAQLISDIDSKPQTPGTPEAKIKALYDCVIDTEGRDKAGTEPIRKYLDAIDGAKTLGEIIDADMLMQRELGISTLLGFGLTPDLADSERYIVAFSAAGASMDKDFYANGTEAQYAAYKTYITRLLALTGLSEEQAAAAFEPAYAAEKAIAAASLEPQDYGNVDKIYNIFTLDELQQLFPGVKLGEVYTASGLNPADRIVVTDAGAMKAAAVLFDDAHIDVLKSFARLGLIMSVGATLSHDYLDTSFDFYEAYYGIDARQSSEQIAAQQVQSLMADYLSRAYSEKYFSPEAKADVESMVREFIAIYKQRIMALDWMSDATKAEAVKKLDSMGIKVGYPDSWDTYLDSADIRSPENGGSFFSNTIAIQRAAKAEYLSRQSTGVDKSEWVMQPFTVNACYSASSNDITFPAAILQAPLYDVNAAPEDNLGGIGYIIAHEITHAFDNNGAKFDENGNAADWWTESDYAAFQEKCAAVAEWYDGVEVYPGITCSGELTISENVADLGSAQCVLTAAKQLKTPDLDRLFRAIANTWASTSYRQMREYLAVTDVHAPDKLRCNRVLQTLPEFYETYGITSGDGMWTEPSSRVSVW